MLQSQSKSVSYAMHSSQHTAQRRSWIDTANAVHTSGYGSMVLEPEK